MKRYTTTDLIAVSCARWHDRIRSEVPARGLTAREIATHPDVSPWDVILDANSAAGATAYAADAAYAAADAACAAYAADAAAAYAAADAACAAAAYAAYAAADTRRSRRSTTVMRRYVTWLVDRLEWVS